MNEDETEDEGEGEENEADNHEYYCTHCNIKVLTDNAECPYCHNLIYFCPWCFAQIHQNTDICAACSKVINE